MTSNQIKKTRKSYNFSQKAFALELGVSTRTVQRWEALENPHQNVSGWAENLIRAFLHRKEREESLEEGEGEGCETMHPSSSPFSRDQMITVDQLKSLRKTFKLSRQRLAQKTGISASTIYRWEREYVEIPEWGRVLLTEFVNNENCF